MRALPAAGLASLLAGIGLIAYAAVQGDVRVGLFLIVPFVYGTGFAPFLGMLLVMGGLVMLMLSRMQDLAGPVSSWREEPPLEGAPPRGDDGGAGGGARVRTKSGGVVLLGPIPIVWGSDRKVLPWMVAAGAALLLLALWVTAGAR